MIRIPPAYAPPPDDGLTVCHIDADLLVVDKPSGLLSVPGRGPGMDDNLVSRVQARFPGALIVHRLDMDTSGLLVMARNPAVHRALGRLFELRKVEKEYTAVVTGRVAGSERSIDLPLIADWPNRPRQMVDFVQGKPALTHLEVLSYDAASDATRVRLVPETGRSHQLRVHLQAIGHPILGDDLYAPPDILAQAPRLLLHAAALGFRHPVSGAWLIVKSEPPF
ncbi:MAG: RluA family pseudouridine synthase [Azonexus sp.]|nr:RluA family pseudouridine synthase [Azonexus sp.]